MPLDEPIEGHEVHYIPGSHKWPEYSPAHFATGKDYDGTEMPSLPDIDKGIREGKYDPLKWKAKPGDVVVFSGMTVHG